MTELTGERDAIGDRFRFHVLGPVEVLDPLDQTIDIGNVAQRLVLVQLLLNPNRVVSTEALIDAVWGDAPPPTARRSLQAHVARLRAALGGTDGPLAPKAPGYVLSVDEDQIDLWRSDRLVRQARAVAESDPREAQRLARQARQEWSGPPLADLASHDPLVAQRRWLDELWLGLNELELDAQLAAGDTTQAVERLESLVLDRPEHEPFWSRLMTGYYRLGRQSDALRAFQRARASLLDQLGIDPSPELQKLEAAILGQNPQLAGQSDQRCPYKGLASYQLDDAERFYGRDTLVAELVEAVRTAAFVVVVGNSGAGKSSALRAGLVRAVHNKWLDVCREPCVITPGVTPLRAIYQVPAAADLVIVDQFEELFTLTDDDDTRLEFVRLLLSRVNDRSDRVVISLRADFYGHCTRIPKLAPLLARRQVVVGPMNEQELRTVIVRPAEGAGLVIDADLVDVVVREAADRSGALPLLSHAMVETWHRRAGGRLTLAAYREAGSMGGAIARTAERVYDSLQPAQREQAERLFLRLVDAGEGSEWARRKVSYAQLEGSSIDREVIDLLVDARLVTAGADGIEIAHEALIGAWPRLTSWLDEDREGLRTHRNLSAASSAWAEVGRDDGTLYRGALLSAVISWIDDTEPDLSSLEREFVEASTALRDRERQALRRTNRRLRRQLTATSVAAVLALVATVIAVTQQRTASRQRLDAQLALLSSTAADLATSRLDVASLLAVEAARLRPGPRSLGALEATLRTQPSVLRTVHADFLDTSSELAATSADSEVVAFLSSSRLTIVGTGDLKVRSQLDVGDVTAVALSPSGQRVAVASAHRVLGYDMTGEQIGPAVELHTNESITTGGVIWADEHSLFITPSDSDSRLVDIDSGRVISRWSQERSRIGVAAQGFFAGIGDGSSIVEHRAPADVVVDFAGFGYFPSLRDASGARFSPDGSWLVADGPQGVRMFQRLRDTLVEIDVAGQTPVPARGVFSPDGGRLVIVSASGRISMYDVTDAGLTLFKDAAVVGAAAGFFAPTRGDFFVFVSDHLVEVATNDREPLATATFGTSNQTPVMLRSDGGKAVSFNTYGFHPSAWDPDTGGPLGEASNATDNVSWFYLPSGDRRWGIDPTTATALIQDDDGRVVQRSDWKIDSDPRTIGVADPVYRVYGLAKSDGTGLVLHDTSTLSPIDSSATFDAARDSTFAVSRDLSMIARASRDLAADVSTIEVVEVQSGRAVTAPVRLRQGQPTLTAVEFTPDRRRLLFGDAAGHIGELDVRSGAVRYDTFSGANGSVLSLNVTPDGEHVMAALGSLLLMLWDVSSHEIVGTPVFGAAPPDIVYSDTFFVWAVPDNTYRYVLVAVKDGLRRWNFDFDSWPSIACERAGRNLTHAEWSQYMPASEHYHVTCPQFSVPAG